MFGLQDLILWTSCSNLTTTLLPIEMCWLTCSAFTMPRNTCTCACALTHAKRSIILFWKLSCHIGALKRLLLPVARQTSARKCVNSEITAINIIIISESQPNYKHMHTCILTHTCNIMFFSKAIFCELHTDISLIQFAALSDRQADNNTVSCARRQTGR